MHCWSQAGTGRASFYWQVKLWTYQKFGLRDHCWPFCTSTIKAALMTLMPLVSVVFIPNATSAWSRTSSWTASDGVTRTHTLPRGHTPTSELFSLTHIKFKYWSLSKFKDDDLFILFTKPLLKLRSPSGIGTFWSLHGRQERVSASRPVHASANAAAPSHAN